MARLRSLFLVCSLLLGLAPFTQTQAQPITEYQYKVTAHLPHDDSLFTQGLLLHKGQLYESAGRYGQSQLLVRSLSSATPRHASKLPHNIFSEGIALFDQRLYQLSWKSEQGLIYTLDTLTPVDSFSYQGQGWGLTANNHHLIMSNGSDSLSFRAPETFKELRSIKVTQNGKPVIRLNELESVNGLIAANIWSEDRIIFVDPATGKVRGELDLNRLLAAEEKPKHRGVLNGIAYDPESQRLYVTGKYWPTVFELELNPAPGGNLKLDKAQQ
jgi:glutamine cyclotransferase